MRTPDSSPRPRLDSVDLLRGFVMVLMALDHVRDFVSPGPVPETIENVGGGLFFTRLITHICAPVFMFAAGVGAFYYGRARGDDRAVVARFLVSRGIWLIVLELTLHVALWTFTWPSAPLPGMQSFTMLLVLWALGCSMILLGGLVWLPRPAILLIAIPVVLLHDFCHFLPVEQRLLAAGWSGISAPLDQIWAVMHVGNKILVFGGTHLVLVMYPIVPWFAVMAIGYAITPSLLESGSRVRRCVVSGLALLAGFLALRLLWWDYDRLAPYEGGDWIDLFSTTKYPPSLPYLLMTMGPALLLVAFFERVRGWLVDWLLVFGRVPLFFYLTHLVVAHGLGALWFHSHTGIWFTDIRRPPSQLESYPGLWAVYICWAIVVVSLYYPCRWFMELKRRRRDLRWLSYL